MHQAATELVALEFIDQETARQVSPVVEAVANMFTILYYQAETGRATPEDFQAVDYENQYQKRLESI
ncbi:type I toxin-antitoxin system ptaRNA1 family toxin [Oceanimonas sp. MB9]|uniref:type I toxin-antitoxin system ptaRNA1 family toxin n=1 Tax=Oceanimonas sp. MB9 TaxID=2588453 RepID=UPI0013F5B185